MDNSEKIRRRLASLINNFEAELRNDELRSKVIALIPAHKMLNKLGTSLVPIDSKAARDRILYYFQKYPYTVISKDEVMIVAGISEWARRLRELRTNFGWPIIGGDAAKEMAEVDEFPLEGMTLPSLNHISMSCFKINRISGLFIDTMLRKILEINELASRRRY